mgnify:CR=1 FL=1
MHDARIQMFIQHKSVADNYTLSFVNVTSINHSVNPKSLLLPSTKEAIRQKTDKRIILRIHLKSWKRLMVLKFNAISGLVLCVTRRLPQVGEKKGSKMIKDYLQCNRINSKTIRMQLSN